METKENTWRRGSIVFAVLAILTAVEYGISITTENPFLLLTVIALAKAGLIIVYFMRLGNMAVLWRGEQSI